MGRPGEIPSGSGDIIAVLRKRIADQEIPSGSRLREVALSREFGVSRGRIREAFGALEARGLIERIPNRGAVVARLAPEQVAHLFDVREMLEGLCARLATEQGSPETWQDWQGVFGTPMDKDLALVDTADADGDQITGPDTTGHETTGLDRYLNRVEGLQSAMIEVAANPILTDLLDGLGDKTRMLMRRILMVPGRARQGLKEHRALLDAMVRGDAESAERLKRINIRSARNAFERYAGFLL